MIFVGGIHGVGKSYFCERVKKQLNIGFYEASELIEKRKAIKFDSSKRIINIESNQQLLLDEVARLNESSDKYILCGHFCLLDKEGRIQKLPKEIFIKLKPISIILLTEDPYIILSRRKRRDNYVQSIDDIRHFQREEINYAQEIAIENNIPILVANSGFDINRISIFLINHTN